MTLDTDIPLKRKRGRKPRPECAHTNRERYRKNKNQLLLRNVNENLHNHLRKYCEDRDITVSHALLLLIERLIRGEIGLHKKLDPK